MAPSKRFGRLGWASSKWVSSSAGTRFGTLATNKRTRFQRETFIDSFPQEANDANAFYEDPGALGMQLTEPPASKKALFVPDFSPNEVLQILTLPQNREQKLCQ